MKRTTLAFCMTALVFAACSNGTTKTENSSTTTDPDSTVTSSTDKKDEPWVPVDSATEMKAWMEYATPGEQHKMLAKSDGNWTATSTMWMKKGAAPVTSTSTMVNKMVMDGRYQMGTYKGGDLMGMPFEGMTIVAYDNYKKKFISTWIDNMGTGIMNMEGTWDPSTKSVNYTGSMTNPANGRECKMREVYTIVDDNNHVMEMYGPDSQTGEEYKTMEIKFTRKK